METTEKKQHWRIIITHGVLRYIHLLTDGYGYWEFTERRPKKVLGPQDGWLTDESGWHDSRDIFPISRSW
ncbi:hypothetical protein VTL71DRAFT_10580 [Oculimacula yallundae]|uniref:Ycf15 n=1 Tax=Oculimacula yallundae TaxID=86028 RepID=A0ABR4CTI7_9HELO